MHLTIESVKALTDLMKEFATKKHKYLNQQ